MQLRPHTAQIRSSMKDFKSYVPENDGSSKNDGNLNNTIEYAKFISSAMNGKSESQLLRTIIAEAEKGKREGRLTNADLDNFYNSIYPMLDGVKRKKLKEVIHKLKQI